MIQRLVKVHDHDHARFDGNAEERNITDPDRHAEVIAEHPLQNQSASHGVEGRKDQYGRFSNRVEDHIKQHEDHKEYDGKNDLEALLGPKLEFVLARPLIVVPGWQGKLL